ncbi:hypothetical protein ABVT39_018380 [Epinephelus coioides]
MDPGLQNNPSDPDKIHPKAIILESYHSRSVWTTDKLPGRAASLPQLPYLGLASSSIPPAPQTLSDSGSILFSIHEGQESWSPSVLPHMHVLHLFPTIHRCALTARPSPLNIILNITIQTSKTRQWTVSNASRKKKEFPPTAATQLGSNAASLNATST